MRVRMLALGLVALAAPAFADDIYRWTDRSGNVHFSNAPSPEGQKGEVTAEQGLASAAAPSAPAAPPLTEEQAAFSSDASRRRTALDRDARATTKHLRELDDRLAALARARTAHAHGTPGTGGLGTNAENFRSPEEDALEEERAKLQKHATEVHGNAAKLHDEVTGQLGTTPEWWSDIR